MIRGDKLNAWQRLEVERQRLKLVKLQNLPVRIREMNAVFKSLADVFMTSMQLKSNFQFQDVSIKESKCFYFYF